MVPPPWGGKLGKNGEKAPPLKTFPPPPHPGRIPSLVCCSQVVRPKACGPPQSPIRKKYRPFRPQPVFFFFFVLVLLARWNGEKNNLFPPPGLAQSSPPAWFFFFFPKKTPSRRKNVFLLPPFSPKNYGPPPPPLGGADFFFPFFSPLGFLSFMPLETQGGKKKFF